MARANEIYVRYYTPGSVAQKVEFPQREKPKPKTHCEPKTHNTSKTQKPKAKRPAQAQTQTQQAELPKIELDGLSVVGIVLSAVMLVCMLVGVFQVWQADRETAQMQAYIAQLEQENQSLREEYTDSYDPEEIRSAAMSMGMIPVEDAQHIAISVPQEQEIELNWWQSLIENIKTLFA